MQLNLKQNSIAVSFQDVLRDRHHGLNQSATRIRGPDNSDISIRPAYSVVCDMPAINSVWVRVDYDSVMA